MAEIKVCDSCIEAARSEISEGGFVERGTTTRLSPSGIARYFGLDISDHVCDARDQGTPCGCECRTNDGLKSEAN